MGELRYLARPTMTGRVPRQNHSAEYLTANIAAMRIIVLKGILHV